MKRPRPPKPKQPVGRPRKLPQGYVALLRTSDRDWLMYKEFTAYRIAHPNDTSKDPAYAAVENKFHCTRSTAQRHMKPLEFFETYWNLSGENLRARVLLLKLGQRLAAFYPEDEVLEILRLGGRLRFQIAAEREELEQLRAAVSGVRSKRTAR